MATAEEQAIADGERQQRRLAQAAAESRKLAEGTALLAGGASKVSPTALALQWAWRFYLPSFTFTSIYIVLHILLRYVFQFKFFCPADQGSPLGGAGKVLSVFGKIPGAEGGMGEKAWIALGLASGLPLAFACFMLFLIIYMVTNPVDFFTGS